MKFDNLNLDWRWNRNHPIAKHYHIRWRKSSDPQGKGELKFI